MNDFLDSDDRQRSAKIKTRQLAKVKKGEHIGGSASPFGYVKSKTVKNAWVVDEAAAIIIRKL